MRGWVRYLRLMRVALGLVLILGGLHGGARRVGAVGVWAETGPPGAARADHTATLLADGSVLVVGGDDTGSAERYEPTTDRWQPAGSLREGRFGHSATRLADGSVLILGGVRNPAPVVQGSTVLASAERYDPATGRWTTVASLARPRVGHSATLLRDGRVLVIGGAARIGGSEGTDAEIYDPTRDRWTTAASPDGIGITHAATLLTDGRVLVTGGAAGGRSPLRYDTVRTYDPVGDSWTKLPSMRFPRAGHAAILLPDGRIMVIGGALGATTADAYATEQYDPVTQRWHRAAAPRGLHGGGNILLLPDGQVLAIGLIYTNKWGSFVERYDPIADRWASDAPLRTSRSVPTVTLLADGGVLAVGGRNFAPPYDPYRSAERYLPATAPELCFTATGKCLRGPFAAYWQAHGGLAINGYPLEDERIEMLADGWNHLVQYCERVRLEYHPANVAPYDILLGQFGRRILAEVPDAPRGRTAALPGATYFPETGHNVTRPEFVAYWEGNGGLAQFGYPLSEEFTERLEDGNDYRVQYFERARFEWHPENTDPHKVLLGQFGRRLLAEQR